MKPISYKLFCSVLLLGISLSSTGCAAKESFFDIHTEIQNSYLSGDYKLISKYARGKEELSKPVPIELSWNEFGNNEYQVFLSKDENFKNIYGSYQIKGNKIDIDNLEINSSYYWYAESNNKKTKTQKFTINTSTFRNLNIEGLTNARDLGGFSTNDNKITNQGFIFRTSRLNENDSTEKLITENGIKEMRNHLKIKSELDLRKTDNNENGGITTSPLGTDINYFSLPMRSGGNCILLNKDVLKEAFAILGNKENYPIVIHCSIGTDRTGMLCFLINALLGVSEEYLYKDYLFSNFGNIGGNRNPSTIDDYLNTVNRGEGESVEEKTKNYLIGLGVKENDINQLIDLLK